MRSRRSTSVAGRPRQRRAPPGARPSPSRPSGSTTTRKSPSASLWPADRAPAIGQTPRRSRRARRRAARRGLSRTSTTAASAAAISSSAAAVSRASSSGSAAASTMRRTTASSASAGAPTNSPVPGCVQQRARRLDVARVAGRAELVEDRAGLIERPHGQRARAGARRDAAERQLAERRLVALAEQVADRRALRQVVIALGRRGPSPPRRRRARAGYSPQAPGVVRGSTCAAVRSSRCCASPSCPACTSASAAMRYACTSSAGGTPGDAAIASASVTARAKSPRRDGQSRVDEPQRPVVPARRVRVVVAEGVARLRQRVGARVVVAANQMDLREAVEDRAGRLVVEQRRAHGERRIERLGGARQLTEADRNLAERAERHGQSVARRILLVQRDGALGQRQRLLVAMADHRDVGLVAARDGHHVVGLHGLREPLGLSQRHQRFVVASLLGQAAARQRVHEREVALVADGMQRRRGFVEVIGHRRAIADQLVAARELEVGQPDGAQVVRVLGVLQRLQVQRDGARLIAARRGHAAVEPPEIRQDRPAGSPTHEANPAGGPAGAGLREVVLQEPGLGQQHAKRQLILTRQRARIGGPAAAVAWRRPRVHARERCARGPEPAEVPRLPWLRSIHRSRLAGLVKPTLVWAGFEADGVRCDTPGPRPPEQRGRTAVGCAGGPVRGRRRHGRPSGGRSRLEAWRSRPSRAFSRPAAAITTSPGRSASIPALSMNANRLVTAVRLANRKVFQAGEDKPDLAGMGTTIVVALVDGSTLTFCGVGDSRIYLLSGSAPSADHARRLVGRDGAGARSGV